PLDGRLADRDPQLQQLAADPLGAPSGIRLRDRRDQVPDLRADARPADPRPRAPPPEQSPPPAVPADDRVGRDPDQVPAPVAPEEASEDPEQLVARAEPWPRAGRTGEDRELVAQQEVLRHHIGAVADGRADQRDEQQQALDHRVHDRRPLEPTETDRLSSP